MTPLWQVVMIVCMMTKGHSMPMEDTAKSAKDSLLTAEHNNTMLIKAQDDSSTHSNPPQEHGPSITEITHHRLASSVKYPDHASMLPIVRNRGENCKGPGVFPDPTNCQFFTFCIHQFQGSHPFLQTLNTCEKGFHFNALIANCIKGECLEVDIGPPSHDPPPPSPSLTEIPSWSINTPAWFEQTPWWFEVPPPWYQIPPSWLKPNDLTEQIQVEAGPGLEIHKPDQIIKNVGVPNQSSPDGKDAPFYNDNKSLRVHIPISIVQQ
ncbi:uncharacterized protein LOC135099828 isoform X2 [Scylla paramamosain]|uniref:uncharacterized protein LOC135099828 isoform X2 n=1 Tax=Scylla paramamosain TaxID=85552 RepID=UPI003082AB94